MSGGVAVLHETATRLRLQAGADADLDALRAGLQRLAGVKAVRSNRRLRCLTVQHDGTPAARAAVIGAMRSPPPRGRRVVQQPAGARAAAASPVASGLAWTPGVLAASVPLLPADWHPAAALGVVATRVLTQGQRLTRDAPAVLLDAASLASLAVNGQPLVVSASVLLRLLAEFLSGRLVRQADRLLEQVLPETAAEYCVLQEDGGAARWWPLRRVRAGDRLRLYPGDVVPVDGCLCDGHARLHPVTAAAAPYAVAPGDHVAAGERVLEGTFELRAECDAAGSRLERLRSQLQHAIGARDPAGRLAPGLDRLVSLPLTGAALVFGLTGDGARAAAMLQADPQQGLDLALPVAREAALLALARHGLAGSGLESIERLAGARTLVLQDTSVLARGRWTVEAVDTEDGGNAARVRGWLAELAGLPPAALGGGGLPDLLVRQWVRHGAVLRLGSHEVHLAGRRRVRRIWGLDLHMPEVASPMAADALRRVFAIVAGGRVVARAVLRSELRPGAWAQLEVLHGLGFDRIAIFAEDDGCDAGPVALPEAWRGRPWLQCLGDDNLVRGDWLADAVHDGAPLVMLHTVLRDLVPAGSLSLTPVDAETGAHGVLLGEPLAGLVTARRLAQTVRRRLRRQQGSAIGANAMLMTAAALRWLPPIATALLHHAFALLVLLDSLRIETIGPPVQAAAPSARKRGSGRVPAVRAGKARKATKETA